MPVPSVNDTPTVRLSTQASRDHGHSWPQRRDDAHSGRKRPAADPRDRAAPWPVRPIKPIIRHDRRRARDGHRPAPTDRHRMPARQGRRPDAGVAGVGHTNRAVGLLGRWSAPVMP
jgi:hypothetical protein